MDNAFKVTAIPIERFESLIGLSDAALTAKGMRRVIVDASSAYPCRVSLIDAHPGERVLLVPFTHHDVVSPYRASGPIFVREAASTASPEVNEIPKMLRSRLLSIRAYDASAMMVGADVIDGKELERHILRFFNGETVEYLHLHNARPGCYNCRVDRA